MAATAAGPYTDPLGRTIPSGTIFDPADFQIVNGTIVRNPFPGNKIPVTSFDPVAAKILNLVPNPLGPNAAQAGSNYLAGFDQSRVSNIPSFKLDQNLGSKLHLSIYFQRTNTSTPRTITAADDLPDNITGSAISANAARTVRVNLDHTLTPRSSCTTPWVGTTPISCCKARTSLTTPRQRWVYPGQTAARTFPIINSQRLSEYGARVA